MTRDKDITLLALAEKAEPYDPSVADRKLLLEIIRKNEDFERQFKEKITDEFLEKVKKEGKCYFAINNVSCKSPISKAGNQLRIGYCGVDEKPLLSIDI